MLYYTINITLFNIIITIYTVTLSICLFAGVFYENKYADQSQ